MAQELPLPGTDEVGPLLNLLWGRPNGDCLSCAVPRGFAADWGWRDRLGSWKPGMVRMALGESHSGPNRLPLIWVWANRGTRRGKPCSRLPNQGTIRAG